MSGSSDVLMDKTPTLAEATRVWWKIGILSFGGPAAQIALTHKEVVEDRNWLSEQQFLNALSFCMLLPVLRRCSWLPMPGGDCMARSAA